MKERILSTATKLFARQGYDGTSLQSIASEVGIQKPSLLYHFPSKAALREAVLEALLARWKDVLPQALLAATSGENRLDATLHEVMSFFHEDPDRARLLMREILDAPASMRERIQDHLAPWISLATDNIKRGQREEVVRSDLDPEAYIAVMIVMLLGSFSAVQVAGSVLGVEEGALDRGASELVRIARTSMFLDGEPKAKEE